MFGHLMVLFSVVQLQGFQNTGILSVATYRDRCNSRMLALLLRNVVIITTSTFSNHNIDAKLQLKVGFGLKVSQFSIKSQQHKC